MYIYNLLYNIKKTLLVSVLLGVISTLFFGYSVKASGVSYVQIGKKITLSLENSPKKSTIEWIISHNGEIISNSTKSKFSYTCTDIGDFSVRATTTEKNNITETTVFKIICTDEIPHKTSISQIKTLPLAHNGVINLNTKKGEKGTVLFDLGNNKNIVQYEIDSDIFSDSDHDGEIGNDIDNKLHPSYRSGGIFSSTYENTGIPARARITTTDIDGKKETSFFIIKSEEDNSSDTERKNAPLKALITSIPAPQKDGNIWLPGTKGTVIIFSGYSQGDSKKFSIDTDTSIDTDGDGITNNDNDNTNTDSFTTGEAFVFEAKKKASGEPQTVQLTITDTTGKKSSIEKKIFFSENSHSGIIYLKPVLFASRSHILDGETVTFEVFSASENATYSWDFDGDGILEIDKGKEKKVEYRFAETGKYDAKVLINEIGKESIIDQKEILVQENFRKEKETQNPTAQFQSQGEGNKVTFLSSESHADADMLNTDLTYSWDFGDGFKTEGPNPEHIYEKIGKYTVTLTVEDALERTNVFSKDLQVDTITEAFSPDQHGKFVKEDPDVITVSDTDFIQDPENTNKNNNTNTENSSAFLWWILIVILFLIPLVLLIPVLLSKIKDPDKEFSVIFEEIFQKKKTKKSLENRGEIIDETSSLNTIEAENRNEAPTQENPVFSGNALDKTDETGETPEWMNNYDENTSSPNERDNITTFPELQESHPSEDSIDPEISEDTHSHTEIAENDESNIPDWLKGADSPFNDEITTTETSLLKEPETIETSQPEIFEDTTDISSEENTDTLLDNTEENNTLETDTNTQEENTDSPFADFEHPDWLEDIKDDDHPVSQEVEKILTETPTEEATNAEDIPDWLQSPDTADTNNTLQKDIPLNPSPALEEITPPNAINTPEEEVTVKKKKKRRRRKKKKNSPSPSVVSVSDDLVSTETTPANEDAPLPDWLTDNQPEISDSPLEPEVLHQPQIEKPSPDKPEISLSEPEPHILAKDAKVHKTTDISTIPEWMKEQ